MQTHWEITYRQKQGEKYSCLYREKYPFKGLFQFNWQGIFFNAKCTRQAIKIIQGKEKPMSLEEENNFIHNYGK